MTVSSRKSEQGFTLIELAIVLMIVGVLVGAFLSTLASRIETTRRATAEKQLNTIKQALYGYAMSQTPPHLPCPDCRNAYCASTAVAGSKQNDGYGDRKSDGSCAVGNTPGNLPWETLGVGSADPWGNRYTYWVSAWAADNTNGISLTGTPQDYGPLHFDTRATIQTRLNGTLTDMLNSIVAVVMSQGKNGYGAMSAQGVFTQLIPTADVDEITNLNSNFPTIDFVSRPPTKANAKTAGGEFDDILVSISEYELKARMLKAGVLPP